MRKLAPLLRAATLGVTIASGLTGAAVAKIAGEVLEHTLSRAAQTSGRMPSNAAARRAAADELSRLSTRHGERVLRVVEDSGLELLEHTPKYGDELVAVATTASPQARRALAMNVSELLPLVRRVGIEAAELEAKSPGQASHIFGIFGDEGGRKIARIVAVEDIPRIAKYGERADGAKTRQLLIETYDTEGASLFKRIPPASVLAGGLTAAMLYGVHRTTQEEAAKAEVLRSNPEVARDVMKHTTTVWGAIGLVVVLLVLWRSGWMPGHRSRPKQVEFGSAESRW